MKQHAKQLFVNLKYFKRLLNKKTILVYFIEHVHISNFK